MYNPTIAPPFGGELQARSGGRKPGAACCQRVRRSGCRFRFDVPKGENVKAIEGGRSLVGAYVRQGLPRRELFPDCPAMRTHARSAQTLRQCIYYRKAYPRARGAFQVFSSFPKPEVPPSAPPSLSFHQKSSLSLIFSISTLSNISQCPSRLKFRPPLNFCLSDKQTMLSTPNKRSCAILRALHAINRERLKAQHTESHARICCTRPQYVV